MIAFVPFMLQVFYVSFWYIVTVPEDVQKDEVGSSTHFECRYDRPERKIWKDPSTYG